MLKELKPMLWTIVVGTFVLVALFGAAHIGLEYKKIESGQVVGIQ